MGALTVAKAPSLADADKLLKWLFSDFLNEKNDFRLTSILTDIRGGKAIDPVETGYVQDQLRATGLSEKAPHGIAKTRRPSKSGGKEMPAISSPRRVWRGTGEN